jgi:hypothetical protein
MTYQALIFVAILGPARGAILAADRSVDAPLRVTVIRLTCRQSIYAPENVAEVVYQVDLAIPQRRHACPRQDRRVEESTRSDWPVSAAFREDGINSAAAVISMKRRTRRGRVGIPYLEGIEGIVERGATSHILIPPRPLVK